VKEEGMGTVKSSKMKRNICSLVGRILLGIGSIVSSAYADNLIVWSKANDNIGNASMVIKHRVGSLDKLDSTDNIWNSKFYPWGNIPYILRPTSTLYNEDLEINENAQVDARAFESTNPVDINYHVATRDQNPVTINSTNYNTFVIETNNNAFSSKPITFEQESLTGDHNEVYPRVDVRKAIAGNGGDFPLCDPNGNELHLNGEYANEQLYAKGTLSFDRWLGDIDDSGEVGVTDLVAMAENWLATGFALPGDLTGVNGIPDGKVDMLDLAVLAEEWGEAAPQ